MMVAIDPTKILSVDDCEQERTPQELVDWVEEKNSLFARTEEGRNYVILRKGLAKKFIEEIYPLSLLAQQLFNGRGDVVCKPSLFEENFDAVIIDYRRRPLKIQKIKFTHAIRHYEKYLRTVYLQKYGYVSLLSKLMRNSNENARNSPKRKNEIVGRVRGRKKELRVIAKAGERESNKRYGIDWSLVMVFDDYMTFISLGELEQLEAFINTEVLPMGLDFGKLFLLSWSGNTLLEFSLGDSSSTGAQRT
ncbi:MAG: hypothetical protein ACE5NW_07770 [Acidiferrobacterales bacterium]